MHRTNISFTKISAVANIKLVKLLYCITDSWIISGWKRQGQMKQEVRNVGKFSASMPSSGSNYLLYN